MPNFLAMLQGFYEAAQLIYKELDKSRILHSLLMDGYESVPSGCKKWLQEQSPGLYQQMTNGAYWVHLTSCVPLLCATLVSYLVSYLVSLLIAFRLCVPLLLHLFVSSSCKEVQ